MDLFRCIYYTSPELNQICKRKGKETVEGSFYQSDGERH